MTDAPMFLVIFYSQRTKFIQELPELRSIGRVLPALKTDGGISANTQGSLDQTDT